MAPPLSNRGGAETEAALSTEQETFEKYTTFLTDSKGRLIEVPLRRGKANSAFIDQISFSIHEDTFSLLAGYPLVADDESAHLWFWPIFLVSVLPKKPSIRVVVFMIPAG